MENSTFYIGREAYGFFKYRYYIKVGNVTDYYYSKAKFVKEAFELISDDVIEQLKLENMLNKLI